MKTYRIVAVTLGFLYVLSLVACNSEDKRLREFKHKVEGQWIIDGVFQGTENVTPASQGERWIEFVSDGTLISDGEEGQIASNWAYNPEADVMCTQNRSADSTVTCWKVVVEGNKMRWSGVGAPGMQEILILYSRRRYR